MVLYVSWAANAVLFVAACFLAADTANAVFASLLAEPEVAVAIPSPAQSRGAAARRNDRQVIVERNLFNSSSAEAGAADVEISEDLEATKLPLDLLGTAAADDPAYAWAAVQDRETRETLVVTIGDVLKQKAQVLRIERRRLVLSEDGEPRELTFGDEDAKPASVSRSPRARSVATRTRASRSRGAVNPAVRRLAEDRFAVPREEVEKALANPADILSQARFLPKYEGEQMVGFQVSGIKPNSVLKQFGLQDGDVITEFNGIEINSPAETARLLQEFNDSDEIDLGWVDRNGNEQNANVQLNE
jgi:general secretion pathway protein C